MSEPLPQDLRRTTRAHRRALAKRLSDGIVVLSAERPARRNGDVDYRFRQDSDFLYLTGVLEPGYALLVDPRRGEETLFVPKLTQAHAVWLGHMPDLAEARAAFGVREVAYLEALPKALRSRARGSRVVYADARSRAAVRRAAPRARIDSPALRDALEDLRITKDEGEIVLLEKASAATAQGHIAAMGAARAKSRHPSWARSTASYTSRWRLVNRPETGKARVTSAV